MRAGTGVGGGGGRGQHGNRIASRINKLQWVQKKVAFISNAH